MATSISSSTTSTSRIYVDHDELYDLIHAVGRHTTVLVLGHMGTGKTSIQRRFLSDPEFADYRVLPPIDCAQLSDGSLFIPGFRPARDGQTETSFEAPNERFISADGRPLILCLDELTKAQPHLFPALAPIILDRRIGPHPLPEGSIVWASGNLASEGLTDQLQAHLRNRLMVVYLRAPSLAVWKTWAYADNNNVHSVILATVERLPQVFNTFEDVRAARAAAGHTNKNNASAVTALDNPYIYDPDADPDSFVSPRSLAAASRALHDADAAMIKGRALTDNAILAALTGVTGEAFAREVMVTLRLTSALPTPSAIFADPTGTPMPDSPIAQVSLVHQITRAVIAVQHDKAIVRTCAEAAVTYVSRMHLEVQAVFANLLMSVGGAALPYFTTVPAFMPMQQAVLRVS